MNQSQFFETRVVDLIFSLVLFEVLYVDQYMHALTGFFYFFFFNTCQYFVFVSFRRH